MRTYTKIFTSILFIISTNSMANVVAFPQPSSRGATAVSNAIVANLMSRGFAANDPRIPGTARSVLGLAGRIGAVTSMGLLGGAAVGIGLGTAGALLIGGGIYMVCELSGACRIEIPQVPPQQPPKRPADALIPGYTPSGSPTAFEHPESIVECTETSSFKNCKHHTDCTESPGSIYCTTMVVNYVDKASGQVSQSVHQNNPRQFLTTPRSEYSGPIYEGSGSNGNRPSPVNPFLGNPAVFTSGFGNNPGSNLTPEQLGQEASDEALARLADALYAAASQSKTNSEPFIARNPYSPITPSTVNGASPQRKPTVGDLLAPPLLANGAPAIDPSINDYPDLNLGVPGAATGTGESSSNPTPPANPELDLGPDPAIPYGPLAVGEPSVLLAPFMDLVSPIFTSDFSRAGGTCPTFGFSIALGDFEFDQLCIFLENYRSLFYALTLFGFIFSSIRIILSA